MNTSLQNIITSQKSSLREDDIRLLFKSRQYPIFQLSEFRKKDELMRKERFQYFIKLLEKWNQRVANRDQTLNDCIYTKNQFIFSWLKSLVVQNSKQIDASLNQLYDWHTSSKPVEPMCFLKKQPSKKVHLQQWEIRNSYKSNLPLEIDNYKRRFIALPQEAIQNSQTRSQQLSPSYPSIPFSSQKQNNYLRNNREAQEMKAYMNNYRKSKVYFYRNMAKNYYQNDFQRDKLSTSSGFYQPKKDVHLQIKNYRIKTTMGQRQFSSPISQMNKTCFSNFSNSTLHLEPLGKESAQFQMPPSSIDGLGLINNPFELKIKKKKR